MRVCVCVKVWVSVFEKRGSGARMLPAVAAPEPVAVLAFQIELHAKQANPGVGAKSSGYGGVCFVCALCVVGLCCEKVYEIR